MSGLRGAADGASLTERLAPSETEDVAFLQYTGGTTGVAKGAMLLHRNVAANVAQIDAWMRPFVKPRRST